jgi:hypothetical protein
MTGELKHPYVRFVETDTWTILNVALDELVENGDIVEQTKRDYIVGYLCKALAEREQK